MIDGQFNLFRNHFWHSSILQLLRGLVRLGIYFISCLKHGLHFKAASSAPTEALHLADVTIVMAMFLLYALSQSVSKSS